MKYTVTDTGETIGDDTRRFRVHRAGDPDWMHTEVWVDHRVNGKVRALCTRCSGVATAMRADCPHANAVKRHVSKTVD